MALHPSVRLFAPTPVERDHMRACASQCLRGISARAQPDANGRQHAAGNSPQGITPPCTWPALRSEHVVARTPNPACGWAGITKSCLRRLGIVFFPSPGAVFFGGWFVLPRHVFKGIFEAELKNAVLYFSGIIFGI